VVMGRLRERIRAEYRLDFKTMHRWVLELGCEPTAPTDAPLDGTP
jgi:hypothetical protein